MQTPRFDRLEILHLLRHACRKLIEFVHRLFDRIETICCFHLHETYAQCIARLVSKKEHSQPGLCWLGW